jgi:hypothetical protein
MLHQKSRADRCLIILFCTDKSHANEVLDVFQKCKGNWQFETQIHFLKDIWVDEPEFIHKLLCFCGSTEEDFIALKNEYEKRMKFKDYSICVASKVDVIKYQTLIGCQYAIDLSSKDHGISDCKMILQLVIDHIGKDKKITSLGNKESLHVC